MMGLVFALGSRQRYILPVEHIREVVVSQELSRIPGSHPAVLGMFHLRGKVIPVIDTRTIVEANNSEASSHDKVIICELGNTLFGLAITEALVVKVLTENERRASDQGGKFVRNIYLEGDSKETSTLLIELDAEALFNHIGGEELEC